MERYPIQRFIEAQDRHYAQALSELRAGKKETHWMWYIFPQLRFLGSSNIAEYYGISGEEEAKEYCANPILLQRYVECCQALDSLSETNPEVVMGGIDAMKLRSSLTLFAMVDESHLALYTRLMDKFYKGKWDFLTTEYLIRRRTVDMRLNETPFQQIKNGEKRIEVRLYDEKRRNVEVGNRICFTHENGKEKLLMRVVELHRYENFRSLFEGVGLEACGFYACSVDEAVEQMRAYYSIEEEEKYGALGIEIVGVDPDEGCLD